MPFTRADVEKHIKGLSPTQQAGWVRIANNALSDCQKEGRELAACEGRAIRIANTMAKRVGESFENWQDEELVKTLLEAAIREIDGTKEADYMADLFEQFERGEAFAESAIDRDSNVISNVKLCGAVSKNKRRYSDKALQDAARLYRGASVYFDHPTDRELRERRGIRSVLDLAGRVVSARKVGDSVRGDIEVLNVNRTREHIFALAEQMPDKAGFSHRARGNVRRENGTEIVEGLEEVFAVELVSDPATAKSLFESVEEETDMKEVTLEQLKEERPDLVKALIDEAAKPDYAALKKELDDLKAEKAIAERKKLVAEKLEEAKLPKHAVTDFFREQLEAAGDDKAIDALIEDRKKLIDQARSGPRSTERDFDDEDRKKELDEAAALEVAGSIEAELFG